MRHHLPQKVLHSKGGSHKDTLLCTPLLWDTPKQQSRADADKEARDELMQRRDWSYKHGYKPRWIIYCTTAIAPMIVEGAEIKPAGARRAPQDQVAVIIPNEQWSPSQQGEEEEEKEDDWSESMPSC